MALSGLIDSRIEGIAQRERQRVWLINMVILAQGLITLMVAPGYLSPTISGPMLATFALALIVYLVAFFFNRFQRNRAAAVFTLLGGGVIVTAAQVYASVLAGHNAQYTAQVALLFLPLILEAGLFVAPELTLLAAGLAAVFSASAILLAVNADTTTQGGEAYLAIAYPLGLEAFIGFLAWRLAQFIYERLRQSQTSEDLRFAQARLDALQRQVAEQHRQLINDLGAIQVGVSSALAHDYDVPIELSGGELGPLASSLNLLIQQLRATNDLERRVQRMDAQVAPLVDMAERVAAGAAPTVGPEVVTDGSLYTVGIALSQAQAMNARRLARLQEAAAAISASLRHTREGAAPAASEYAQAQQLAGQLVSLAEYLNQIAVRQADLLSQARRALALLLPEELTAAEPVLSVMEENSDLMGLGTDIGIIKPGLTGIFPALPQVESGEANDAGIAPLTAHFPAVSQAETGEENEPLPAALADAWRLLSQLYNQTLEETRQVTRLAHDMGVLGGQVRRVGIGFDWTMQSVEAVERHVERLQQLAGGTGAGAELGPDGDIGTPAGPTTPRRAPLPTRPLDAGARQAAEAAGLSLAPGGQSAPHYPVPEGLAPGSLRVSDLLGPGSLSPEAPQENAMPAQPEEGSTNV